MNLFAVNTNGLVLRARQAPPCSPTWTGWTTPGYTHEPVWNFAAGIDGNDDIVLAAQDLSARRVYHANYQLDAEAQQWSGWMPFATATYPALLALEYNADGRLTYFRHHVQGPA